MITGFRDWLHRSALRRGALLAALVTLVTIANGAAVVYEYDDAGRLKTATFDGATQIRYDLDPAGNRTILSTRTGGALQFASTSYSVAEGGGSIVVSVQRVGSTTGACSVTIATVNGTALAGSDFVSNSTTLNWAAGDGSAKTFTVAISQDALSEGPEIFTVNLTNATGGWIGIAASTTVTIADDETAAAGTLQFASATATIGEAAGTVTVNVSRTGGSNGSVSVVCSSSNGTALAASDYTSVASTISWSSGDAASKPCTVPIINGAAVESAETFTLGLASAIGTTVGSPSAATVTISDDDVAVPTTPTNFRASPPGLSYGGNFSVLWDASTGNPSYYTLEESYDAGATWPGSYTINHPTLSKAFNKGEVYAELTYRIKACNAQSQCSGYSNTIVKIVCPTNGCP